MFCLLVESLTRDITPTAQKNWPASIPLKFQSYNDAEAEVSRVSLGTKSKYTLDREFYCLYRVDARRDAQLRFRFAHVGLASEVVLSCIALS